jgi:hypothetical protein
MRGSVLLLVSAFLGTAVTLAAEPAPVLHLAAGDFTVFGLEQPGDRFQRRRLAGAIGAEQRHDRAFRHIETQSAQHQDDVVIHHLDVVHAEHRGGGGDGVRSCAARVDNFSH